jgi:thioester reductase-like protein
LRVSASILQRGGEGLRDSESKVICHSSSFRSPNLGLFTQDYVNIKSTITHIIHAAWAVNFSLPLKSFIKDHIFGLYSLLNLSISSLQNVKMIFCSSTASILSSTQSTIPESISINPEDADTLGYSRSKWVAESVCYSASQLEGMQGRIKVLRIGQLTGDTENGIWNMSEAWPLMLSTVDRLGCLPDLKAERLDWVPVDVAAKSVVEIAFHDNASLLQQQSTNGKENEGLESEHGIVYHLVANRFPKTPTWSDMLAWVQKARSKTTKQPFEVVEPEIWLTKFRSLNHHPAKPLLGLWERAYGGQKHGNKDQLRPTKTFETSRAAKLSESMKNLKLVDEELVAKIWGWIQGEMVGVK